MNRQEFLTKFGISMAAVCAGCGIASCGSSPKDDPTPSDNDNNNPPNGSLLSADLNSELKSTGDFKVASGIIIVRLATGNTADAFTAVQVACTHQGTAVNYNNAQGKFICPNHGSQFSTTGAVLLGPATTALKKYTVTVNGNTLNVTA
ncbi:ubiquinol-cytochrome c reductase iron-sulfur subunit [Mucilaginibacter lacusdianchii]|uniref:QcrA and Rieske domain-containing protein n=1 Tax=Mucilaginibacter lacusdianchii TaxID=2684211 RepID=UPI00131B1742|nr:Rieske (2Fe-2S) protein [Mucilaginibacter sp. JXJ CY 39]